MFTYRMRIHQKSVSGYIRSGGMKKAIAILCLLVLACACCSCDKEDAVLAENTLYAYDVFMDTAPEKVDFTLKGEFPPRKKDSGSFSGYIKVEESNGTKHTYKDLRYVWEDDILLLYSGNPTAEESKGVLCWVDPEDPERTFIADRNWCEQNETAEIIACVSNELTAAEKRTLGTKLNQIAGVYRIKFESAQQVLDDFVADSGDSTAFQGLEANDLRARYRIVIYKENAKETISEIEKISGIEDVYAAMWAPESIRLIGPEKKPEKMKAAFEKLPELPA